MIDQKTKDWILEDLQRILENIDLDISNMGYLRNDIVVLIVEIERIPIIPQITVGDFKQMISKDTYNLNTPRVATFPFDDKKGSGVKEDE